MKEAHFAVYHYLVDEINMYDDVAFTICRVHAQFIDSKEGEETKDVVRGVLQQECAKLNVNKLPDEDYFFDGKEYEEFLEVE